MNLITTLAFDWIDLSWLNQPAIRIPLTVAYVTLLLLVSLYGLHRWWLMWVFKKTVAKVPRARERFAELPVVTIQLPMFNEATVAERVIDAACEVDYPAEKLQIQVLDDSTDACKEIARRRVEYWANRGVDIEFIHRVDRTGFKAGALANGCKTCKGSLIAIFDADFVPPPSFLRRTVHYFTDPKVAMVQTRWDHINREDSVLTRSQAIFLDGHFVIEHTARNRGGAWFNFNGTGGVWRREAIDSAGGWQHDTLTEDLDLSYRSQLVGWRFVHVPSVTCPAELPPEMNAFKSQQHRWTKGSIQTALKILPRILRSKSVSRAVKTEAFFHLTSPMVYLYVTLLTLLFYPAFYVNMQPFDEGTVPAVIWCLTLFTLGTASAGSFYVLSQGVIKRSRIQTVLYMPVLMSVGIGIAVNNARAVIEALMGHQSPFVRTPKFNAGPAIPHDAAHTHATTAGTDAATQDALIHPTIDNPDAPMSKPTFKLPKVHFWMAIIEVAMGLYMVECCRLAMRNERTLFSTPFLALFAAGYLYVGIASLWGLWQSSRMARTVAVPQVS